MDWRPGDSIVIVSSHRNWNEAEQRTITSVLPGNTTLMLESPLTYSHTGVVKSYTDGTRTWTADFCAPRCGCSRTTSWCRAMRRPRPPVGSADT